MALTKVQPFNANTAASYTFGSVSSNNLVLVGSSSSSSLQNNGEITGWNFANKSFDVSAQETVATGIFFKTDGTRMYIIGTTGDDITEYSLSTAWDITTATAVGVSIGLVEPTPQDLFINSTGTKCYVVGSTHDAVREYNFSTAWQANTLTFVQNVVISAQETVPTGITFKPDLTQMFICGTNGDGVDVYDLSSAGNVASAVFNTFVSLSAQDTAPAAIQFNSDGTQFYMMGSTGDDINSYNLSVPYDLTTATFYKNSFYWGFIESSPAGMFLEFSQNKAWIVGSGSDAVRELDISGDGLRSTAVSNYFDRYVYVGEDFDVRGNAIVESQLTVAGTASLSTTDVSGTFTPSGTVTMSTTTGTISIGTSQTTGTVVIGGTSQTGAITVGRSTGNQSIDIGNGITASGNVKTITIGTLGASGSNTNITIGSVTSGANTSITMYGNVSVQGLSTSGNIAAANIVITNASRLGTITSGTWNGSSISTTFTDAKIVSVSNTNPITATTSSGVVTIGMANSGVTAATYGGASSVPVIVVDQQGRITSASNVTVASGGGGGNFNTSVNRNVGSAITSNSSAIFTAPSTAGIEYIIHSIHVTNINATVQAEVTGSFDGTTYPSNINFSSTIPVPVGTAVELLKRPKVLQPNDKIQISANVNNALHTVITYETQTSTSYFGSGVDITSAATATTLYTAASNSMIESILLTNDDSSDLDVKATVTWTDASDVIQGYYCSNLVVPNDATIEILEAPKYLENGHKIRVEANQANRLEAIISGKSQ